MSDTTNTGQQSENSFEKAQQNPNVDPNVGAYENNEPDKGDGAKAVETKHDDGIGPIVRYVDGKSTANGVPLLGLVVGRKTDENGNDIAVIAEVATVEVRVDQLEKYESNF